MIHVLLADFHLQCNILQGHNEIQLQSVTVHLVPMDLEAFVRNLNLESFQHGL